MSEEHYLLMRDTPGEKAPGTLKKIVGITNTKRVLRGELLRPIPREKEPRPDVAQPNYYSVEKDPAITLFVVDDDISPLNIDDYYLLKAIDTPSDRFRVFSHPHWLEWGAHLKVGSMVYVRLPSPNESAPTWSHAIVRYKGPVKNLCGMNFGVEITDPDHHGKGTSDGIFQNHSYFHCPNDCGLFVSLEKLRSIEPKLVGMQGELQGQQLASGHQSVNKPPSYAAVTSSPFHHSQPSHGHKKPPAPAYPESSDVDPPRMRFKIDDQVVVFDKHDTPLHGSIRWIGRKNLLGRDLGELHVGIEMGVYVNPNEIPKAKTGLSGLFNAKKNHSIVIPESMVVSTEAYTSKRERSSKDRRAQQETGDPPPYPQDPVGLAREFKMTKTEFEEQKRAMKEHEEQKRKKDQQKAKREVKQALGESITAAEQQRVLDEIKSQAETGRKQGSPDQSNLDVGRKDMRRQRSLQPHVYDTIPGGAGNDSANIHRRLDNQGKSSSIAQAEGCSETFQSENVAFHAGHHGGHADHGGYGGHGDHGGLGAPLYDLQHKPSDGRAQMHENLHDSNQHQGGSPPQHNCYHSNQLPGHNPQAARKPDHDYVNIYDDPKYQKYIQPNPDAQPMPPDQPGASHHHTAGATDHGGGASQYINQPGGLHHGSHHGQAQHSIQSNAPQYMDQPSGSHHQENFAAVTAPPGSNLPVNPYLTVDSRIQIATQSPTEPFKYGVIRWIGEISAVQGLVAGIEMDDYMEGCTDGTLTSTGQKFFECMPGRGIYYPLVNLQPDVRFMDPASVVGGDNLENPLDDVPYNVAEDQFTEGRHEQIQRYIGDRKGIQGHQNSCYLDSSIFGLFALTDAFDELFLKAESSKTADQNRQAIADLLWKGIVNPLRKNGVVRYESVMALRTKLDELGKMEGIAHAEKDPEEFLNMLFKHTLKVDPFLTIRRPYGDEPEFFVQLFVEYKESDKLPSIGLLLHTMFKEQKLSFLQMPSRLLIQVPRFGRQFKTYDKIIPDLKLSVTDLTDEYIQAIPKCFVCNESAEVACKQCAAELYKDGHFCSICSGQFHAHPNRKDHVLDQNIGGGMDGSSLDLLSVICIETSHYVCFTKEPSEDPNKPHKWIFFDSMANRVYDRFNIPSVTECSELLNQWVYPANGDLSRLRSTVPRDLPEYVRRFTQDVYLCVYVNTDAILYGY